VYCQVIDTEGTQRFKYYLYGNQMASLANNRTGKKNYVCVSVC